MSIAEHSPRGYRIGLLPQPQNNENIIYKILYGNEHKMFDIDNKTKSLQFVNGKLDRKNREQYELI
ncbi:unnamed protein product, partial [Didymodactylos carnosus]